MRCWLAPQLRAREGESAEEVARKQLVMVPNAVFMMYCAWESVTLALSGPHDPHFAGISVCAAAFGTLFAVAMATHHAYLWQVEAMVFAALIGCLLIDWSSAATLKARTWALVVVGFDCLLVVFARQSVVTAVAILTTLWLLLIEVEGAVGLGLLHIDGWSDAPGTVKICDCEDPPCAVPPSTGSLLVSLGTLHFDLFITKGFAAGMRSEQQRVYASISAAQG
eukprot:gene25970-53067_t